MPFSFNMGEHLVSPLSIVTRSLLTDLQTARDNDDLYSSYQLSLGARVHVSRGYIVITL